MRRQSTCLLFLTLSLAMTVPRVEAKEANFTALIECKRSPENPKNKGKPPLVMQVVTEVSPNLTECESVWNFKATALDFDGWDCLDARDKKCLRTPEIQKLMADVRARKSLPKPYLGFTDARKRNSAMLFVSSATNLSHVCPIFLKSMTDLGGSGKCVDALAPR